MHILFTFLVMIFFVGCAIKRVNEYPLASLPLDEIGLTCSNIKAQEIAVESAKERYPNISKKLDRYKFSIYQSEYSGKDEPYPHKFYLKSVFKYYPVGKISENKFYEESLSVVLTKDCKLIDVQYFKGMDQITH